jgi:thioredoxin-dependent peroxiredoxin
MENRCAFGLLLLLATISFASTALAQRGRQATPGREPPHPPKVGEVAPDFELRDLKGEKVSLKQLMTDSPVVLLVLRGWYGRQCPICNRQVGEFLSKKSELSKVQVVMIYPGESDQLDEHAKQFIGSKSFPDNYHFLLDPDFKFTKAWGLRWETPGETAYPSTFVVDQKQKLVFGKTVISHGDRADVATVLSKLP